MWEKIYDIFAKVLSLTIKTEQHDKEIEKLNAEVKELNALYRDLIIAINRVADRQESEREKILALVENQLLKFERRLPTGKETSDEK
jgi:archaellum component FlaC